MLGGEGWGRTSGVRGEVCGGRGARGGMRSRGRVLGPRRGRTSEARLAVAELPRRVSGSQGRAKRDPRLATAAAEFPCWVGGVRPDPRRPRHVCGGTASAAARARETVSSVPGVDGRAKRDTRLATAAAKFPCWVGGVRPDSRRLMQVCGGTCARGVVGGFPGGGKRDLRLPGCWAGFLAWAGERSGTRVSGRLRPSSRAGWGGVRPDPRRPRHVCGGAARAARHALAGPCPGSPAWADERSETRACLLPRRVSGVDGRAKRDAPLAMTAAKFPCWWEASGRTRRA
ncbi:hypothetical protein HNR73_000995 [Phytomonospora endophytica]|uniref:Uncharacterized protein n=1 Tax=Phytomonospora endophytica TaxID=714109 RepID=A0A841FH29_9ACTN|nr:hypothetical protein [Phytomonospora endophytica]